MSQSNSIPLRVQPRFVREALRELLHADSLWHLDAVHLQDVRLARPDLDEAVPAVRAHVGLLARVRHSVVLEGVQRPELELAQVARQRLLAVRLHVMLQVRLDLEVVNGRLRVVTRVKRLQTCFSWRQRMTCVILKVNFIS